MINVQDGIYTRTQAFNFLKGLLEVPKSVLINEQFFYLFFSNADGGMYLIKTREEFIRQIFKEKGIAELNRQYYYHKNEKTTQGSMQTRKIFEEVKVRVQTSLAQAA